MNQDNQSIATSNNNQEGNNHSVNSKENSKAANLSLKEDKKKFLVKYIQILIN